MGQQRQRRLYEWPTLAAPRPYLPSPKRTGTKTKYIFQPRSLQDADRAKTERTVPDDRRLPPRLLRPPDHLLYPAGRRVSRLFDRTEPDTPALLFFTGNDKIQRDHYPGYLSRTGKLRRTGQDQPQRRRSPDSKAG